MKVSKKVRNSVFLVLSVLYVCFAILFVKFHAPKAKVFTALVIGGDSKPFGSGSSESLRNSEEVKEKPKFIPKVTEITLSLNAQNYSTGEKIPEIYKGKQYTVLEESGNRTLLWELNSWINNEDISDYKLDPSGGNILGRWSHLYGPLNCYGIEANEGDHVHLLGTMYSTGESIPVKYRNQDYTVVKQEGDKTLLKELNSWVNTKDLDLTKDYYFYNK